MITAPPKFIDAVKVNTQALLSLSKITVSSVRRLNDLNLVTTGRVLEQSLATTNSIFQTKDEKNPKKLQKLPIVEHGSENAVAYIEHFLGIVNDAQTEAGKIMSDYYSILAKDSSTDTAQMLGFGMFHKVPQ